MMTCEQCRAELAEYGLGRTSTATASNVADHLSACPVCRRELAELEEAWSLLPTALPPAELPPDLFDRILARINDADPQRWNPSRATALPVERLSPARSRRERVLSYVVAASLFVGLSAAYWRATRSERPDASIQQFAERLNDLQRRETERLLESDGVRVVSLHRPNRPVDSEAFLIWDLAAKQWHFYATGLPPAPADRTYQLWAEIRDGRLTAGPTFQVDDHGLGSIVGDFPELRPGDAVKAVVTLEPIGGSTKPSETVCLEADL